MLRQAVQRVLLPIVVFLVARRFLGNGDAFLVAALAHALAEARRRWRSFEASVPSPPGRPGRSWTATPVSFGQPKRS